MNSAVIDLSKAERREVAPVSEATALIQVIERAARDPSVDIERMERLLQMHERLQARKAKVAYADALARLQPKLPLIKERGSIKNSSGAVQSRYAFWEDIVAVITPILASEGFSLSFRTGSKDGKIQVTGVLAHAQGHSEETTLELPADTSGSKNAVQAVASSVSYGKRYTSGALLNLRTGEIDDDGRAAAAPPTITETQVADLNALLTEVGADKAKFMRWARVTSLNQILACNYEACIKAVEAKRK